MSEAHQRKSRTMSAVAHTTAAGISALFCFPLWKMATIGQSGWKTEGQNFFTKMGNACKPPYKGVAATLFGMTWARAAIFHYSEQFKPVLLENGWNHASATSIPPLCVGTFAQVVNMPLVRATITLQNPASVHVNILQAFREIIQVQGVKGLWHGTSAAVGKTVPKYIVAVAIKDYCERHLALADPKRGNVHAQTMLRSAKKSVTAGLFGAALTNPFDVIRNEMFKTNLGVVSVTKKLYEECGLSFIYRGVAKNMIAVALPVALTIFISDQLKSSEMFSAGKAPTVFVDQMKSVFGKFDANGNGEIDLGEFLLAWDALKVGSENVDERSTLITLFLEMDVDGNGGIDFGEFTTSYDKYLSFMENTGMEHEYYR